MRGQPGWAYGEVVVWWPDRHTGFARVLPDEGGQYPQGPYDVMVFQSTTYPYFYRPQKGDMLAMRVRDEGKGPFAKVAMQTGSIGLPMIGRIKRGGPHYGFVSDGMVDYFFSRDAVVEPLSSWNLFPDQPVVFYHLPDAEDSDSTLAVRVMPVTRVVLGGVERVRVLPNRVTFRIRTAGGCAMYTTPFAQPVRVGDAVRLRVLSNQLPATKRHPETVWWAVTMEKIE